MINNGGKDIVSLEYSIYSIGVSGHFRPVFILYRQKCRYILIFLRLAIAVLHAISTCAGVDSQAPP